MPLNKDIITRVVVGIIIFVLFAKVVGPIILEILKKKIPGSYNPDTDIDSMIRRQKERLRAQYGLVGTREQPALTGSTEEAAAKPATKEIETLYKESRWGGGEFVKNIKNEIAKNYSYTLADTKIHAFILLSEKRNYLRFLSTDNQKSQESIARYLSLVMLMMILIEEIRNKEFTLLEKIAKKCHVENNEMMLALQLKILFIIAAKKEIKQERLFETIPTLHHYSEETMKEALDSILKKEANLWAKGHSYFIEELALFLSYAELMTPFPKLESKTDLSTAYAILRMDSDMDMDEIKKSYKKLVMEKHPDKIGQMKLPPMLEKKAVAKFNQIQEAYDIINKTRKK